jgi:IMP dehydrogenase
MGSIEAMKEGSKDRYFQLDIEMENELVPEGIVGRVPYRGSLAAVTYQLIGGLKSGMGYLGCKNIGELKVRPRFMRVTGAGLKEAHVHDVDIIKEAPNYRME